LLSLGYKVFLYTGDQDYICNWFGGEAWTNAMEWEWSEEYRSAKYTKFADNRGNVIGR